MISKLSIPIILVAAAVVGCSGRADKTPATGPDSRYTYQHILNLQIREPGHSLALVDTA